MDPSVSAFIGDEEGDAGCEACGLFFGQISLVVDAGTSMLARGGRWVKIGLSFLFNLKFIIEAKLKKIIRFSLFLN